jgi:hypothetical protein
VAHEVPGLCYDRFGMQDGSEGVAADAFAFSASSRSLSVVFDIPPLGHTFPAQFGVHAAVADADQLEGLSEGVSKGRRVSLRGVSEGVSKDSYASPVSAGVSGLSEVCPSGLGAVAPYDLLFIPSTPSDLALADGVYEDPVDRFEVFVSTDGEDRRMAHAPDSKALEDALRQLLVDADGYGRDDHRGRPGHTKAFPSPTAPDIAHPSASASANGNVNSHVTRALSDDEVTALPQKQVPVSRSRPQDCLAEGVCGGPEPATASFPAMPAAAADAWWDLPTLATSPVLAGVDDSSAEPRVPAHRRPSLRPPVHPSLPAGSTADILTDTTASAGDDGHSHSHSHSDPDTPPSAGDAPWWLDATTLSLWEGTAGGTSKALAPSIPQSQSHSPPPPSANSFV